MDNKLDQFLSISEKELLQNAGKVSAEEATLKAIDEFEKYRSERIKNHMSDFDTAIKEIEKPVTNETIKNRVDRKSLEPEYRL